MPIQVDAVCSVAEVWPSVGIAGVGTLNEAETPVMPLPVTTAPAQLSLYSTSEDLEDDVVWVLEEVEEADAADAVADAWVGVSSELEDPDGKPEGMDVAADDWDAEPLEPDDSEGKPEGDEAAAGDWDGKSPEGDPEPEKPGEKEKKPEEEPEEELEEEAALKLCAFPASRAAVRAARRALVRDRGSGAGTASAEAKATLSSATESFILSIKECQQMNERIEAVVGKDIVD
jgi:hypothetical protein